MSGTLHCQYVGRCGGCPAGGELLANVVANKSSAVRALFPALEMRPTPPTRVRDRADLVWERDAEGNMRLGLYGLQDRAVVDLEACPMMTEPLENWFKEFRSLAPPIRRGSVRLRVSPAGERGAWLDFANQDVKALFEQRTYLEWLSARAVVEIGQRRKVLVWRDGQPKLIDSQLKSWFETYDAQMQSIPLYGPVGGFSQTGFAANRALVEAVCDLAKASGERKWLELFCGNGNFALALAARAYEVEALELDALAVQGLEKSSSEIPGGGLAVKVQRSDVYLKSGALPSVEGRAVLVDPPRAGLRELLAEVERGWRPKVLIYVSCYTEVFLKDAARLTELGYELKNILGVDQFPYTPHCEWVAMFANSRELH